MIKIVKTIHLSILCWLYSILVFGQNEGIENLERLTINFKTGEVTPKILPFDVPFILMGEVPKGVVKVEVRYVESKLWDKVKNAECNSCFDPLVYDSPCTDPDCLEQIGGLEDSLNILKLENAELQTDNSKKAKKAHKKERKRLKKAQNKKSKQLLPEKVCQQLCPWEVNMLSDFNKCGSDCDNNMFWVNVPPLDPNKNYNFYFKFHFRPTGTDSLRLTEMAFNLIMNKFDKFRDSTLTLGEVERILNSFQKGVNNHYRLKSFDGIVLDTQSFPSSELEDALLNTFLAWGPENYAKWRYKPEDQINSEEKVYDSTYLRLKLKLSKFKTLKSSISSQLRLNNLKESEVEHLSKGKISTRDLSTVLPNITSTSDTAVIRKIKENLRATLDTIKYRRLTGHVLYQELSMAEKKDLRDIEDDLKSVINRVEIYERYITGFYRHITLIAQAMTNQMSFSGNSALTTLADFKTRTEFSVTADIGVAAVHYEKDFSNKLVTYYGVNFNIFPINRQKRYSIFRNFSTEFYKNLSIVVGITNQDLASGRRFNSLKNSSVLTGIGVRVSEPVRMTFGGIWNEIQPDPLSESKKLNAYPYISFSFDLDVVGYIQKISDTLFK